MFTIRKSAFTLVELIIIIVIIGILAAAFIPKLNWIQARVRDTARTSDLRNISIAIQSYKVDNWTYPTASYLASVSHRNVLSEMIVSSVFAQTVGSSLDTLTWSLSSYLKSIPNDPSGKGVKSAQWTNNCIEKWSSYAYASNGSWYAITAKSESRKGNASSCGDTIDRVDNGWYKKEGEWLTSQTRIDLNYPDPSKWTPTYNFTFNNGQITAYSWPLATNIIIPYQSDLSTITSIGMNTFWGKQTNSVIIPPSVTDIWTRAFAGSQLPNLTIPNSVINIWESAFSNNRLTTLNIPNSVTTIWANAFSNNQISNLTIPNSVTTIWETVFESNRLTTLTIPNSVTSIGYRAFASNQLTSITIPNSVTSIWQWAFASNQLTSFTLPASITTISSDLFTQNRLTSVTIPNSVTTIWWNAFSQNQINNVSIPSSVISIGGWAFATNQLTSITIPNSVKTIGNRAFATNKLTSITIPNSVTSIWQGAFQANNLTSITIPSSVTSISINAFIQNWPNRNSGNLTNFVPWTNQTRNLVGTTWVKQ